MQTETLDSDAPTASGGNDSIAALAKMYEVWKERAQVKNEESTQRNM